MGEERAERGQKPNIPAIMQEIRTKVSADVAAHKDQALPFRSYSTDIDGGSTRKAGELVHSEELRYLNLHHAYSLTTLNPDAIKSHRPGIVGKLIVKAKRKLLSLVWTGFLREYVSAEKDFNANLVRFLNDMSKYIDARDASNFWELIRKVDVDTTRAMERIERINDEMSGTLHSVERRIQGPTEEAIRSLAGDIAALHTQFEEDRRKLAVVDGVVAGLEGIVARLGAAPGDESAARGSSGGGPDYKYVLLENRYRGSEAAIRERLAVYVPIFKGAARKVLEIGPGRGELQLLFAEAGIPSYGVDTDAGMVDEAKARKVNVELENGIEHLRRVPDGSLGGLIAIQVVEHMPFSVLEELFALCYRKVAAGGRIVFETIDPRSLLALSSNYFRDPTHVTPLHPDTLAFAMSTAGLRMLETRRLSPVPSEALLKEIPTEEYMTPRWELTIERLNANIRQLNELLYGYQDYCVIAERP